MKDSQDWLDKELQSVYTEGHRDGVKTALSHDGSTSLMIYVSGNEKAKSAIRKHILQEALEILGEDSTSASKPLGIPESRWLLYQGRDSLRQELRNKFNDKYKED